MLDEDKINELLGIKESYQAPQRMLDIMMNDEERLKLFDEFLGIDHDVSKEWFHGYFENEHAQRKKKKQDFTPQSVSNLLSKLIGQSYVYHEATAGTGGILIQHWQEQRMQVSPFAYDTKNYWHHLEELSDRAVPFLIFNMAIRGMNGVVLHGDSLTREFKTVYFIRNMDDSTKYSEVIKMPKTEQLEKELDIRSWEE